MGLWKIHTDKLNLSNEIRDYLKEIGEALKIETDNQLDYKLDIISSLQNDLTIRYSFNVVYEYKGVDKSYELINIGLLGGKLDININYIIKKEIETFETFSELKTYIEEGIKSEEMANAISYMLKFVEMNNCG